MDFNITSYVRYNILSKFDCQGARLKVKAVVAFFFLEKQQQQKIKPQKIKHFAMALVPTFINGF